MSNAQPQSAARTQTDARASLFTLALLALMYLAIHGPYIVPGHDANLEGPNVFHGDFTYYVDGAISVLQADPYEKFNNKHQPILGSRPVPPGALPPGSALAAALYPFPSFKFGYSLTAAALTWPFDQALFQRSVWRLGFTNLLLGAGVLVLMFLILQRLSGSLTIPAAASVFYILDAFNIHNNFLYQSHTLAGLFYVLVAYYLFLRSDRIGPPRFFLIANILFFALLTSSHVVLLAATLGGLMCLWLWLREPGWPRRVQLGLAGFIGVALWPAYIRLVEIYIGFKELGMPRYHEQFSNYGTTVSNLISTYPLLERQLWDLRLWNRFIWIIVLLVVLMQVASRYALPAAGASAGRLRAWLARSWSDKSLLFLAAGAAAIAGTAFYSQPIVRAIVPHLLFLDVMLGVIAGAALLRPSRVATVAGSLVAVLLALNYFLYASASKDGGNVRYVTYPTYAPGNYVWRVSERPLIWKYVHEYFDKGAYLTLVLPKGKLGQYSMTVAEFVEHVARRLEGDEKGKHLDELWVRIEPMELAEQYSNTRRFIPRFTPLKENIVDLDTILKDFRLLNEIFGMLRDGRLQRTDVVLRPILYWHPVVFDQEYNSIYGYNGHMHELMAGAPINDVDFRSIYFIKYAALRKAAGAPPR